MVSINTNISALISQTNLNAADSKTTSAISKLSSGNRIVRAADDAAGLAVGTGLRTDVSTLRTALTNTSQAVSVLSLADGALSNIAEILQRQKALSVQANSGSLSSAERAFLDQEFQSLTDEIDRIATTTNFNGISLIDGTISGDSGITTDTTSTEELFKLDITFDATMTAGDALAGYLTINGISFGGDSTGTGDVNEAAAIVTIDVDAATTGALYAQAIADVINNASGSNAYLGGITGLPHDAITNQVKLDALQGLTATVSGSVLTISSKHVGAAGAFTAAIIDNTDITSIVAGDETITANAAAVSAVATSSSGATGSLGDGSVTASGTVGDNILTAIANTKATLSHTFVTADLVADATITVFGRTYTIKSTVTNEATQIQRGSTDEETVANIASFLNNSTDATITQFDFDVTTENDLILRATSKVETSSNSTAYTLTDTNGPTATNLTAGNGGGVDVSHVTDNADFVGSVSGFTATLIGADTVKLSVTVGDYTYEGIVADTTAGANTVVRLRSTSSDGKGGYFDITLASGQGTTVTTQANADTFAGRIDDAFSSLTFQQTRSVDSFDLEGTLLEGGRVYLEAESFSSLEVSSVDVKQATSANSSEATISVTLADGRVFENTTLGTEIHAGEKITLSNVDNSNEVITIINGITTIALDNASQVARLESELTTGLSSGSGGLDFQVGIDFDDSIAVALNGATTDILFAGNALNILDTTAAATASGLLDAAIDAVSTLRASIGSLQSRFDFAAANLETSIQNTDAARADFLDADIAGVSSEFAKSQVLVQASISVLAQANQLPQNLLKLIG